MAFPSPWNENTLMSANLLKLTVVLPRSGPPSLCGTPGVTYPQPSLGLGLAVVMFEGPFLVSVPLNFHIL